MGLSQCGHTGAEGDEPGLLGTADARTMAGEAGTPAATVVAGQDIGGLSLVEGIGLAGLHDVADETVRPVGAFQIAVVGAGMGELVGVAESHIQHLRMGFPEGFQGEGRRGMVGPLRAAEAGNLGIHFLDHRAHGRIHVQGLMGGTARETAAFVVHGIADGLPGGEHHHLPLVSGILVYDFQDAHVGVRVGVVAVDTRIVRPAAEHLAVARIGEIHGVRHPHQAVLFAVADQVAMLCAIAPQERKQHFATFLGRVPPVSGLERLRILDKAGVRDEGFIGAGEKFLPAQAVKGHDHEAGVIVFLAAGD